MTEAKNGEIIVNCAILTKRCDQQQQGACRDCPAPEKLLVYLSEGYPTGIRMRINRTRKKEELQLQGKLKYDIFPDINYLYWETLVFVRLGETITKISPEDLKAIPG